MPRNSRIWFAHDRFHELAEMLFARGYLIDPAAPYPNGWDEHTGLVQIRAVPLAGDEEDAEPDERISFTITEWWSQEEVPEAQRRRGLYLAAYSYHGQVSRDPTQRVRYDFDPVRHPESPYHRHDPHSTERRPSEAVSPEEALDDLERLIGGLG